MKLANAIVAPMAKNDKTISAAEVRELFIYNPDTGDLTRRVDRSSNATSGKRAGCVAPDGYQTVRISGRAYKVHRLIWLIVLGSWPEGYIDHIDGDTSNNRWNNLRIATHQQNTANAKRRKDNSTGYKGVKKLGGRFQARLGSGGRIHIGTFDTAEDAHRAYINAARSKYGNFAREK